MPVSEAPGGGKGHPETSGGACGGLPADADAAKVDAQLADGILTVRVPKAPQAQARQIEIKG